MFQTQLHLFYSGRKQETGNSGATFQELQEVLQGSTETVYLLDDSVFTVFRLLLTGERHFPD